MGGIQYINTGDYTQISVGKWDYDKAPNNWQFNAHSKEEARKGYPSQALGITKAQAMRKLNSYIKEHKCKL